MQNVKDLRRVLRRTVVDSIFFYVAANLWVRYGAPGEKYPIADQFFTKRTLFYSECMYCTGTRHKINPASLLCTACLNALSLPMPIRRSLVRPIYKKARTSDSTF